MQNKVCMTITQFMGIVNPSGSEISALSEEPTSEAFIDLLSPKYQDMIGQTDKGSHMCPIATKEERSVVRIRLRKKTFSTENKKMLCEHFL